jgi:hypothetical protein
MQPCGLQIYIAMYKGLSVNTHTHTGGDPRWHADGENPGGTWCMHLCMDREKSFVWMDISNRYTMKIHSMTNPMMLIEYHKCLYFYMVWLIDLVLCLHCILFRADGVGCIVLLIGLLSVCILISRYSSMICYWHVPYQWPTGMAP